MTPKAEILKWCVQTHGWMNVYPCRTRNEARELRRDILMDYERNRGGEFADHPTPHVGINPSWEAEQRRKEKSA